MKLCGIPGSAGVLARHGHRRGSILILVLWIVVVLGIAGIAYTSAVRTQLQTARLMRGRHIAAWAARAGVEQAKAAIRTADLAALTDLDPLLNDQEAFLNRPVGAAAFTLVGAPDSDGNPRYGLVDESSRISINRASETMLMSLAGVTAEMAEGLLDWRDDNDEALPDGAERDYYEALPFPYPPKNGAFDSVRELMRVKGWGPVFDMAWPDPYKRFRPEGQAESISTVTGGPSEQGAAAGIQPGEDGGGEGGAAALGGSGESEPAAVNTAGTEAQTTEGEVTLDQAGALRILSGLTAWSAAPATNPDGGEKVNIGTAGENELSAIPGLSRDEVQAIVAWQRGQGFRTPADLLRVTPPQNTGDGNNNNTNNNNRNNRNNRNNGGGGGNGGGGAGAGGGQPVFSLQRAGEIIDYCATRQAGQGGVDTGRININTASREVLMAIPGMTEELADAIVAQREGEGALLKPGDVARLAGVDADSFRRIYPWICTSTSRFHVTSQGRDPDSGAVVTVEAVLAYDDQKEVRVLYWREF